MGDMDFRPLLWAGIAIGAVAGGLISLFIWIVSK